MGVKEGSAENVLNPASNCHVKALSTSSYSQNPVEPLRPKNSNHIGRWGSLWTTARWALIPRGT
jgi:hypothetical protein